MKEKKGEEEERGKGERGASKAVLDILEDSSGNLRQDIGVVSRRVLLIR